MSTSSFSAAVLPPSTLCSGDEADDIVLSSSIIVDGS